MSAYHRHRQQRKAICCFLTTTKNFLSSQRFQSLLTFIHFSSMAVDDQMAHSTTRSTSSSSSCISPSHSRRQRLIQVATTNSSTFIHFPSNRRQSTSFVPVFRACTRMSSPMTTDTYSSSNHSKISGNEHQRSHSQQRLNPILTNPLLNHRKEQVKFPPMKTNSSSQPLKTLSTAPRRASAVPLLPPSDPLPTPAPFLDEVKFDYITRWLEQIRLVTHTIDTKA